VEEEVEVEEEVGKRQDPGLGSPEILGEMKHEPVLLDRVIEFLASEGAGKKIRKIVDCTLGLGGYSERVLRTFPEARVYGLDRDPQAIAFSVNRLSGCPYDHRFQALRTNFGAMEEALRDFAPFDAFVFDLGVSNMQLTKAERGFSFQQDGPLDMRMDPEGNTAAADVLESLSAADLAKVFWTYGEERYSRRIAAKIEERRKKGISPKTTGELVSLIREVLPAPVQRKMGTHPARRVFQALRIYVNDELKELERGLSAVENLSSPEALVIVVSYHSLEDRIVKYKFRAWEREEKKGTVLTKHPALPDDEETERNFKARSAKLRAFRFRLSPGIFGEP
jgi:16S rRNA (cytosine1402-N4)-methyltransferase